MRFPAIAALLLVAAVSSGNEVAKDAEEKPSFDDIVAKSEHYAGLFDVYRDRESGDVHLAIPKERLGEEYVHVVLTADGPVEGGHFRGFYRDNKVVAIRRHFDRIEFINENTNFYFDPENALSRAATANISTAVLAVEDIVAENDDTVIIKADSLFLGEGLHQVKDTPDPEADPKTTFALGKLSESRNKIYDIRSYPDNTDVFVEYVYENPEPIVHAKEDVTDSRFVSIRVQHSFIAMPDNDFMPRLDDPRIGYFASRVTDLTTDSHTPYRDIIMRWNLQKKDPGAAVSEPVQPIVWWIENTTPLEYRELIRDAALAWNPAFEKAGFRNAIEVRQQPDDADWDAGDIAYNVLRWTSSPQPPFGGYGPAFLNPRTGQILGADIMLEFSFLTRRVRLQDLLDTIANGGAATASQPVFCSLGHGLQVGNLFAMAAIETTGGGAERREQLVHDAMHYLILHEIGHTLGLNHNMRATQMLSPASVHDADTVAARGLTGSVMDYPAINVAPPGREQTWYYQVAPGPYDDWAIEFGYSPDVDDPVTRNALLDRSTEPDLAFGNDADDMREAGKAIDPRVNIYDMSSDPITYATERFALIADILRNMREKYERPGQSWQALHDSYLVLATEFQNSANVVSRYVGGVHVNRAMIGQPGATTPFVPVAKADQRRAMRTLEEQVFAPGAFRAPGEVYSHLRQQRRGFDFYEVTEDPKLADLVLAVHKGVLDHLLHPAVQRRITDSTLYGNQYPLVEVMQDLTAAVFERDLKTSVDPMRQNLQIEYVKRLLAMLDGETAKTYDYVSQSTALANLRRIESLLEGNRSKDASTRAHREHVLYSIRRGLDETT